MNSFLQLKTQRILWEYYENPFYNIVINENHLVAYLFQLKSFPSHGWMDDCFKRGDSKLSFSRSWSYRLPILYVYIFFFYPVLLESLHLICVMTVTGPPYCLRVWEAPIMLLCSFSMPSEELSCCDGGGGGPFWPEKVVLAYCQCLQSQKKMQGAANRSRGEATTSMIPKPAKIPMTWAQYQRTEARVWPSRPLHSPES